MSGNLRELRHLCGLPSLILANEWELRHLCPKKKLHHLLFPKRDNLLMSFPGGPTLPPVLGRTLMSFLVVLTFCLGDNSDRCGILCIFWLGWLMDVGRYEGVAPSMSHSLHWDHRPVETQRGDTKGRHKGETKGRKKGGNKQKKQNEQCHFYSFVNQKGCFCKILKCLNCAYVLNNLIYF